MKRLRIILLLIFFETMLHQITYSQEAVPRSVLGSGGTALSSEDLRMFGTLGQAIVGVTSNSSNSNKVGFWYLAIDLITSVEQAQASDNLPTEFRLQQNYPNPFNPSTTIRFAIPQRSDVTLKQLLNDGRSGIFGFQPQNTILTVCMIHRNSSFFGLSANHV